MSLLFYAGCLVSVVGMIMFALAMARSFSVGDEIADRIFRTQEARRANEDIYSGQTWGVTYLGTTTLSKN